MRRNYPLTRLAYLFPRRRTMERTTRQGIAALSHCCPAGVATFGDRTLLLSSDNAAISNGLGCSMLAAPFLGFENLRRRGGTGDGTRVASAEPTCRHTRGRHAATPAPGILLAYFAAIKPMTASPSCSASGTAAAGYLGLLPLSCSTGAAPGCVAKQRQRLCGNAIAPLRICAWTKHSDAWRAVDMRGYFIQHPFVRGCDAGACG